MSKGKPIKPRREPTEMLGFVTPLAKGLTTLLLATTSPSSSPSSSSSPKVLRVCTSPACKDDGAISTYDRLTALAPPCLTVIKGGCTSLCGSGPIVELCDTVDAVQSIKRKRVKDDVLTNLLNELLINCKETEDVFPSRMYNRLIDGYNSHILGNAAYQSKDYKSAIDFYEEAIQNGRKPALALQEARDTYTTTQTDEEEEGYPPSLEWLITTFQNSCQARLSLNDIDGARRDAFASIVFSRNKNAISHECLANVCHASGDGMGEYQAVKAAIKEYDRLLVKKPCMDGRDAVGRAEDARVRRNAEERRRELGFRLDRLERELKRT
jgi:tetratricopeptide (TPR) repeat protein